jgi:hypothetical protein
MDDPRAAMLIKRYGTLQTQRTNWESHWQEIADYIVPRKADITKKRTPGDKRTELIFDGTAIHAAELMSASLHGMLTNAATPWFSLRYENDALNGDDEAQEWLLGATDVMYQHLARSNFQEQIHELYSDLVTFGTAVIFIESDNDDGFRFSTRHISECYVSEDEQGRVDTVFRKYKTTARAAVRQFGEQEVTQRIAKLNEQDPYAEIELLHVVLPREVRNKRKRNTVNKPVASIHIDPDEKKVIGESGFDEFPYCTPGGLNFYRSGTRDRIEPLNIGANNPLGEAQLEQRRQAIRAAFYVDQLILGQGPQMTATEVIQRTEEKMRLLGPVLGRLQAELLQPLIGRCFAVLTRQKAFAPAPAALRDGNIDIEYVSPLAKAQRSGDIQGILQMIEFLMPLMQLDQSVADYLDTDGLAKHVIKVTGTPATVVRGDGEVSGIREERALAQQAEAEMMAAQQMAETAGAAAPAVRAVDEAGEDIQSAIVGNAA